MAKTKVVKSKVTFSLMAPDANDVKVAGDFTNWQENPISLKKLKSGLWKTTVSLEPGIYQYRFIVDGVWQNDPQCQNRVPNCYGSENCLLEVK